MCLLREFTTSRRRRCYHLPLPHAAAAADATKSPSPLNGGERRAGRACERDRDQINGDITTWSGIFVPVLKTLDPLCRNRENKLQLHRKFLLLGAWAFFRSGANNFFGVALGVIWSIWRALFPPPSPCPPLCACAWKRRRQELLSLYGASLNFRILRGYWMTKNIILKKTPFNFIQTFNHSVPGLVHPQLV